MDAIYVLAGLMVVVAVLSALIGKGKKPSLKAGDDDGPWPFYAKRPLTSPEQVLYHRLVAALPDHIVLAQVQLSRFLGVQKPHNFHAWNNRINRMSADFLVCAKDSSVLAVIELDDPSHRRKDRQEADAKKNRALEAAGIRLVRWDVKSMPDESAIRKTLS